jgi:Protein of unknown function (DUF2726)
MFKRLLNGPELHTHDRLARACAENSASVFSKIRLADVLPIEQSGITAPEYKFCLQAHFDFVVADSNQLPLFAVEFDGPTHRSPIQQKRDATKERICEKFSLPLLRINARYLDSRYRDMDLLTWFVQVWFAQQWFNSAQERGDLPGDESFSSWFITSIPGSTKNFPLWLSAAVRNSIQKLWLEGKVLDMVPAQLIGRDNAGNYHAIAFIRLTETTGVVTRTAMRCQQFPVSLAEAMDEIVSHCLYDKLKLTIDGRTASDSRVKIEAEVEAFVARFEMRRSSSSGGTFRIPSARGVASET